MHAPELRIIAAAGAVVVAWLLGGCATPGSPREAELRGGPDQSLQRDGGQVRRGDDVRHRDDAGAASSTGARQTCCIVAPATSGQRALGRTAARFVGASRIEVRGQRLPYDCSGLARAVYLVHGVDLYDGVEAEDTATGVQLIYRHVASRGRLHRGPDPRPGDLVFFHNTWDRNGDGRLNDPLTHVGIVERVEADGTVVFVSRVSRGVQRYRMNLGAPHQHRADDGRVLNDYIRRKRSHDPPAARYLTGELFAAFGTLAD